MMHHAFLNWPLKSRLIRLDKKYTYRCIIIVKDEKLENKNPISPKQNGEILLMKKEGFRKKNDQCE